MRTYRIHFWITTITHPEVHHAFIYNLYISRGSTSLVAAIVCSLDCIACSQDIEKRGYVQPRLAR